MRRKLLRSSAFVRAARRLAKKSPDSAEVLREALALLAADAFHPQLRTHKLKGPLKGSRACSVEFDLRILFRFVDDHGEEAILLESVGTHKEVY